MVSIFKTDVSSRAWWANHFILKNDLSHRNYLFVEVWKREYFPEAIEAVFPSTLVQTCMVHMIRASLSFVSWKERKVMAADLKLIYKAATAEMAEVALEAFRAKYPKHRVVADVWSRNWQRVIPFFDFPEEIRKIIYTTNAIESLHMTLRKVTKNRGSFPNQESAIKLLYLALQKVSKQWNAVQGWREALRQFAIRWPERLQQGLGG